MALALESRLENVEFLLELAISKLPFPGGLQDLVDLILRYRLTEQASTRLMDDVAAMERRVTDGQPVSGEVVRDTILASYETSRGPDGGTYGGAGPYAYVTQVLAVLSPQVLLPIWQTAS